MDANWDLGSLNWQSPDALYLEGDSVIFDDTATGNFDVNLDSFNFSAPVAITYTGAGAGADLTVQADGSPTVSGVLNLGTGNLAVAGAGTLTLTNGANHYGNTTVNSGTLALSGAGILGTGTNTVATGAFLALAGSLNAPFASLLAGDGILLKNGTGNAELGVVNGLAGGTRIDAGLLLVGGDNLTGPFWGQSSHFNILPNRLSWPRSFRAGVFGILRGSKPAAVKLALAGLPQSGHAWPALPLPHV